MYEMRLYILNITKPYSEDEDGYTGEWFDCPVDFEEVKEKLGVKEVEEIEIADYELPFSLTPSMSLWEINGICRQIQEIEGTPGERNYRRLSINGFRISKIFSTTRTRYSTMTWQTLPL